jgi:glycosyltransferase involved in cell wall biosynthesis
MEKKPTISVILPTYNSARTIGESIDSVLKQTYPDFELIVVDDGSTDNTKKIVYGYTDRRIIYIYQSNQERSAARNKGIAHARGKYIAFIDSDDIWIDDKLAKQFPVLEADKELGLVYSDLYHFDDETGENLFVFSNIIKLYRGKIKLHLLLKNCFIQSPTPLVRREVINVVGPFDPSLVFGEDWDLWLRIAAKYPIDYIDEPLARVRVHKNVGSLTKPSSTVYKNTLILLEKVDHEITDRNWLLRRMLRIKRGLLHYNYGMTKLSKGEYGDVQSYFQKAMRSYPSYPKTYFRYLQIKMSNLVKLLLNTKSG